MPTCSGKDEANLDRPPVWLLACQFCQCKTSLLCISFNFLDFSPCSVPFVAEDPCKGKDCDHNQTCVVQDGLPVCQPKTRLCSAWGHSHYHTFDGRTFDFHGTCNYTFVRAPCHASSNISTHFEVQIARATTGKMTTNDTTNASAPFDRVLISVQGFNIAVVKGEQQQVWVRVFSILRIAHAFKCSYFSAFENIGQFS